MTTSSTQTRRRPPRRRARAPRASESAASSTISAPSVEQASEFTVPDTEPLKFETLGFHDDLISGIRDRGFAHTTPIQSAVLPLVRGGGDIVACAETGTGKTAAFVLPLVDRLLAAATATHAAGAPPEAARTRVLVLTPTRELAVQIDDDVQGFGYHAGVSSMAVYGGAPMEPQSRALAAGIPFVVATPGRLMDHMRSGTKFDGLETLVLDEADRMLDMGFWPDVRRIVDALPAKRQTLLFSATMPNEILGFARAIMTDPALIQVGRRNAAARTISHAVEHIPTGEKTDWLAKFLRGASRRRSWSSSAPSAAPTSCRRRWPRAASGRRRCTPTARRRIGCRRSRASSPAASASWSRPTSRRAGSTSTASPTSSTTTSRTRPKPTSIASAAPAARWPPATR